MARALPIGIDGLGRARHFGVVVERAVFLTVLHRLFVSGSDPAAEKWRADYRIDGTEGLHLHHLYRAMAWLGEPLADQTGASGLAPRCRRDVVEEALFNRRRELVLPSSASCSWTPPACPSRARAAPNSAAAATRKTSGLTSTR